MISKPQQDPKIPTDLGIKIGTKEEAFWTRIRDETRTDILNCRRTIVMDEHILTLAEKKITEEKAKSNQKV